MTLDGFAEHVGSRPVRPELQQVVSPVEEVLLGGVHVRGLLILLLGRQQVARRLFRVAEQVPHLGGVAARKQGADELRRPGGLPRLQVMERPLQLDVDRGVFGRECGALRSARSSTRAPLTFTCLATVRSSCRKGGPVTCVRVPPRGEKSVCPIAVATGGSLKASGL